MKLFYLSFSLALMIGSSVFAQQHIPSFTTDRQTITFDAEIVEIVPAPKYLVNGWKMLGNSTMFGTQSTPIQLLLEYDVAYTVNMMGRPADPLDPDRATVTDTVTITATDEEKIRYYWNQQGISNAFFHTNEFTFETISNALKLPLE